MWQPDNEKRVLLLHHPNLSIFCRELATLCAKHTKSTRLKRVANRRRQLIFRTHTLIRTHTLRVSLRLRFQLSRRSSGSLLMGTFRFFEHQRKVASVVSFSSVASRVRNFQCVVRCCCCLLFSFCSPRQRERKIHTYAYRAPSHTVKINSTLLLFPRRVIVCVCISIIYILLYIYIYGLEKQHQNLICAKFIDDYVLPVILFRCVYKIDQ